MNETEFCLPVEIWMMILETKKYFFWRILELATSKLGNLSLAAQNCFYNEWCYHPASHPRWRVICIPVLIKQINSGKRCIFCSMYITSCERERKRDLYDKRCLCNEKESVKKKEIYEKNT